MIVIVIIGLLAGAATINVRRYLTTAKQNIARQDLKVIGAAIDTFWAERGRYPTNDEGLRILVQPEGGAEPLLTGTEDGLRDPWGQEYVYNCPASGSSHPYEVICYGANGREGGDGADEDIVSPQ
jgi:general secretion pathway protein G